MNCPNYYCLRVGTELAYVRHKAIISSMKIVKCKCGKDILLDDNIDTEHITNLQPTCGPGKHNVCFSRLGTKYRMAEWILPKKVGFIIDHKDRNTHNNLISNLRYATIAQNNYNSSKAKHSLNKYKGVRYVGYSYCAQYPWLASICFKGIKIKIGYFDTPEKAALAYNNAAIKYFEEFAALNIVQQ